MSGFFAQRDVLDVSPHTAARPALRQLDPRTAVAFQGPQLLIKFPLMEAHPAFENVFNLRNNIKQLSL